MVCSNNNYCFQIQLLQHDPTKRLDTIEALKQESLMADVDWEAVEAVNVQPSFVPPVSCFSHFSGSVRQPPLINLPKFEEFVVAYRSWWLTRVEIQEVFYEEKTRLVYFLERMYCMQFLGYNLLYYEKNPCCQFDQLIWKVWDILEVGSMGMTLHCHGCQKVFKWQADNE